VHYDDGYIEWEDLKGADEWRYCEVEAIAAGDADAKAVGIDGAEADAVEIDEADCEQTWQNSTAVAAEQYIGHTTDQWTRGICDVSWQADGRKYKWETRIVNAVHVVVGSSELAMLHYQSFNRFRLVRQIYQPTRAMCKHEVAYHAVREISIGNWFPCRCVLTHLQ
jgi:hypothetical protein